MSTQTRSLIATIAGFAALGLLFLSLVYWVLLANPPLRIDNIDITLRVLLVSTIVAFTVYILVSPESVGRAAAKRSTRLTANAIVGSLVAIAIGVVVTILVESSVTARADWTAGQDFAISEQTKQVLRQLGSRGTEVRAIAFFNPEQGAQGVTSTQEQAENLLKEYRSYATNLRYEIVDPFRNPQRALDYGISRSGVVVFDDGTKRQTANTISESDFTSAILRLLEPETKTVAFLTGHGEHDPNGFEADGYSRAKQSLELNNFTVITWRLVTSPTIPVDRVDVLVIAAPQSPIPNNEIQAIQSYLNAGGRALVLTDPEVQQTPELLQPLATLLRPYNVEPVLGAILDQEFFFSQSPLNLLVSNYPAHPINEALSQGRDKPTLFPVSLGLRVLTTTSNLTVVPIIQSSSSPGASWLETTLSGQGVQYDPGQDIAGPVNIGVAVSPPVASETLTTTQPLTQTRLVVFGDSSFGTNTGLGLGGYNVDLFGNAVSWLAGANELVSIRPKEPTEARRITLDPAQKNLMFTAAVLGLPLLVVLAGGVVWWRRR